LKTKLKEEFSFLFLGFIYRVDSVGEIENIPNMIGDTLNRNIWVHFSQRNDSNLAGTNYIMYMMTKQYRMGSLFIYLFCKQNYVGEYEKARPRRNCDWKLRSESRPDVQDDIQAIDGQQEDEIWIDPGMKAHPVAHWDWLDNGEEEDIEYTDNEDDLGDLENTEINAFTLLIKSKEKDHNFTIKYHRGPKLSRSIQKRERKKQNELAIAAAGSYPLDKGFLISAPTAESTPPDQNIVMEVWYGGD
jgi:hypothetical protein